MSFIRTKPSRSDLLGVISRLQDLVGCAIEAYANDRATDRADRIAKPLNEAFTLCIKARAADPPSAGTKSKFVENLTRKTEESYHDDR